MRRNTLLIGLLAVVMLACSCRSNGQEQTGCDGVQAVSDTLPRSGCLLSLPDVPVSLTVPEERAAYIIAHFWDRMDFSDTLRCRNRAFMEQNFVNYLSLFPHAKPEALPTHIARLLERAAADSICLDLVNDLAEHYLDNPNSPMRNEEYYILFLEGLLSLPTLPEAERIRPAYQLEMARKNRPGTTATDFAYIDRHGNRRTLHNTKGEKLMLLFYDPECEHCSEILRQVHESNIIRNSIDKKELTILAVYTEGNRKAWDGTKNSMPQEWTVAIDESSIVERELYALPAMPVIYLLDRDKKVMLKDAFLPEIEDVLISKMNRKTQ